MQGTTLVVRITGAMLVLCAVVVGMMMVHVIDPAAIAQVGSDVLFVL